MSTVVICLALAIVLMCPSASTQWVRTSLDNVNVTCLAINGTNLFAGIDGGIFLSTNNGTSWTAVDSGLTYTGVNSLAVSGTNLFAGTYGGGVFLSTNNGVSWTAVNQGLPKISWDTTRTVPIGCFAVSGTNLFAGTGSGDGVFLSTNNGTSWTAVNNGLPKYPYDTTIYYVNTLAVSGTNLFAGTYGGVFLSTNNGASWAAADAPFSDFSSIVHIGPNVFAGTSGGVFLSTNNGAIWTAVDSGLVHISALAVSGTNLFAGTGGCGGRGCRDSLFLSTNNGASWTEVDSSLRNGSYISALVVLGTNLFAGLLVQPFSGGLMGVWRRPLSEMITSLEPIATEFPHEFLLQQNYPNPFNPTTKIQFTIVNRQTTILKVYDVMGRDVATLVNEVKQPGTYTVQFDGSSLASGVYFYRLQARDFVSTKKMLITK